MAYLGIDVGSGSARAGLFDQGGTCLGQASAPLDQHRAAPGRVSQSSEQIWHAICSAVRETLRRAEVDPGEVRGLGFDATCSMVVSDELGGPVGVDPGEADGWDVIMWMDHRATGEAAQINLTGHPALRQVGGRISPEMQAPKLLWLKRNHHDAWRRAAHFTELPDWLTWRATGSRRRSLCSVICKWMHDGRAWASDFYEGIGLHDLAGEGFARLGTDIVGPGSRIGGLSDAAAEELGLNPGTPVGASLIDAYAGTLQSAPETGGARLALIAGTSACHITLSLDPAFVPGMWGPYPGVLLPGMSADEAGQSAAGALLDVMAARRGNTDRSALWAAVAGLPAEAAAGLHVLPDILGNRSPRAEPEATAALVGFGTDTGPGAEAREMLAAVQSLAYETRQIIEVLRGNGVEVDTLVVSGGLAKSEPYLAAHAGATGCRVLVPEGEEPVLLGSAMLAAAASGDMPDLPTSMTEMSGSAREIPPAGSADYHDRKYSAFLRLQATEREMRTLMEIPE
jgi:ribulose kinase